MKFLFQFSSHQNRPTAYNHLKHDSVRRQCLVCKGTGVNPDTAQDAPPVPAPKKKLLPGILESIGRKFR